MELALVNQSQIDTISMFQSQIDTIFGLDVVPARRAKQIQLLAIYTISSQAGHFIEKIHAIETFSA